MNHLAHFLLAEPHPLSRTGALLGDLATGTPGFLLQAYPPRLVAGILRHRWIDAFTQRHPSLHQIPPTLSPHRRRFAGVISDVLFDHLLVRDWGRFSPVPLADFIQICYEDLKVCLHLLPDAFAADIRERIEADWLSQYHSAASLRRVFFQMSWRSPRFTPLSEAESEWLRNPGIFEQAFSLLWPDLTAAISRLGPESLALPPGLQDNHLDSPRPAP